MEFIKAVWLVVFLLFALTLIFIWSKVYIVSRKTAEIDAVMSGIESINAKLSETVSRV